jgi:hypothetical protein
VTRRDDNLHSAIEAIAAAGTDASHGQVPAWQEEQLKEPVRQLLITVGNLEGFEILALNEAPVAGVGRADIGVAVNGLLCGYVELKAPGKGADPGSMSDKHDRDQWERFKRFPNVLYTDGRSMALYRSGERVRPVIRNISARAAADQVQLTLKTFFSWTPIAPRTPQDLAEVLAPLCRLLRDEVLEGLRQKGETPLKILRRQWETTLLATRTAEEFADEYAQTITYALLLARVDGAKNITVEAAADQLDEHNDLLAQVLRVLGQTQARESVSNAIDLLERCVNRIEPRALERHAGSDPRKDPWLYFYEDFLQQYDAERRKQYGVYYTPVPVVAAQVALVGELLETRFGRRFTYLDDVVLLDPAVGTGSYPLTALTFAFEKYLSEYGPAALAERIPSTMRNVYAFERFMGPYAIAHLRLTQLAAKYGADPKGLKQDGVRVYLTDTLSDPDEVRSDHLDLFSMRLTKESDLANRVKREVPVFVCIGNPPYLRRRDDTGDFGGWIRHGGVKTPQPLFDDFLEPLREVGRGSSANTVHELSVYFWRWALWKVFEQSATAGIISFISPRAYLASPGHAGMRKVMRSTFDDLWILDLGGDNRGAEASESENVFAIETGVCIAIGVRYGPPDPETPAKIRYALIEGSRSEKLARLNEIGHFEDVAWSDCPSEWMDPLLPVHGEAFSKWPDIRQLFPWQISGAQFKRTWPIAESREILEERWSRLLSMEPSERRTAFGETRDRLAGPTVPGHRGTLRNTGIEALPADAPMPTAVRYAYRALDRRWVLYDERLGDFIRPALAETLSDSQVFFSTLMTKRLGPGPAITATECFPDMDFFCNRGAADIIPLYRDASAEHPNVTSGILKLLESRYHRKVNAEDLYAYVAAILGSPSYVGRFAENLRSPGPRVPLTSSPELFERGVELGSRFVWLQTYGERWVPAGERRGRLPKYSFDVSTPIPKTEADYPEEFSYNQISHELLIGSGVISNVEPKVFNYEQSKWPVIDRWLAYRMRGGAGRAGRSSASELDGIRPRRWTFTSELLDLLRAIKGCVDLWPSLDELFTDILDDETIAATELPTPLKREQTKPQISRLERTLFD